MIPRWLGWWLGGLLAVAIPLGALTLAAGAGPRALGLAVPPFGWTRLEVVHLLASLPLALLLAGAVPRMDQKIAWNWAILGLVLAVVTIVAGARIAGAMAFGNPHFFVGVLARFSWCILLELPWCLLGRTLAVSEPLPARWPTLVLAGIVALVLPGVYVRNLIETQSLKAEEMLRSDLTRARSITEGLCQLGSSRPLNEVPPEKLLRELEQVIKAINMDVEKPLGPNASPLAMIQRATSLLVLGRDAEAVQLLAGVPATDREATLLRATLLQKQKRFHESSEQFRRALDLLERDPPAGGLWSAVVASALGVAGGHGAWLPPAHLSGLIVAAGTASATTAGKVRAYSGLAFNARERQAYREAEAAYFEALEKLPSEKAYFHFQLGKHYQQGGRFGDALDHLEKAARLDPAAFATPAQSMIDKLNRHTPGCFMR